jgi:subtilisin family serine protease
MPSDEPLVVRVAVIDSGIHPDHPHVLGVAGGVAITPEGEHDDYVDRIGHGTAVAAAIRERSPQASLFAVKVFDRTLSGSVNTLVRAVDWAVERGCHVINMSLGTARLEHAARLHTAVERARAAGAILVAAREDGGQQFLPGSLPGVIGVVVD